MIKRLLVFIAAATGCIALDAMAAASCEKLIATGIPDYPPYLWRDPAKPRLLIGTDADLLKQIGEQLGVKVEVLYTGSRAEAEEYVRSGRADLLIATRLSLAQLQQMDYVYPAMQQTLTHVWMHKGRQFSYAGWDDLLGRTGGSPETTALSPEFDSFSRQSLLLQRTPEAARVFQKLLQGQVDFVLAERYPGQLVAAQLGMTAQLEAHEAAVSSAGLYLALSHNSACNDAELRGQLAIKMTELVDSGVPEALLRHNIQLWQAQQVPALSSQKD